MWIEPVADCFRQLGRVAHDHAQRFASIEQVLNHMASDIAGRRRDDDHGQTFLVSAGIGKQRATHHLYMECIVKSFS